jgi:carbonic anhydrase
MDEGTGAAVRTMTGARQGRRFSGLGRAGQGVDMQKLVQGVHNFREGTFGSQREFFEKLVAGQRPMALFITCSDSRICPNLITQTEPGDLFIMRNAGNIVPAYGAGPVGGEAATIEFAVSVLGVPDIIVCGHSHCGAMKALMGPSADLEELPATRAWLGHAEATRRIIKDKYQHLEGDALLMACVEENVLVQIKHLKTHPVVASAIARGTLNLHGWVYKLQTGQVFAYDPVEQQFKELERLAVETNGSPVRETIAVSI